MSQYGQFCPVAKAMELLDERWTMLIVRELIAGSHTFGDLQRGVPKMSPTLLSTRLRALTKAGVIDRHEQGKRVYYTLTQAGRELQPVVESIGKWGIRWMPEHGDLFLGAREVDGVPGSQTRCSPGNATSDRPRRQFAQRAYPVS